MTHQTLHERTVPDDVGRPGTGSCKPPGGPRALQEVPPVPWVVLKLVQTFAMSMDEVRIDRLVELIRADGSLSSELLRRVNSAMYGLRSRISSLNHAAVVMGLSAVRSLAMTVGMRGHFLDSARLPELHRCWRHSLASGVLAEELAHACDIPPDSAYTAGLLHDMGRMVLLVKYPQDYCGLLAETDYDELRLMEEEKALFELNHCEVGAALAQQWDFPEDLVEVIAEHHAVLDDQPFDKLRVVQLSCRLASSFGFGLSEAAAYPEPEELLNALPGSVRELVADAVNELQQKVDEKVRSFE